VDRRSRKEALSTILAHNFKPHEYVDEILRAGGSTPTYNLDQIQLAAQAEPIVFDEDDNRYIIEDSGDI
jgi:hypothetical protein